MLPPSPRMREKDPSCNNVALPYYYRGGLQLHMISSVGQNSLVYYLAVYNTAFELGTLGYIYNI